MIGLMIVTAGVCSGQSRVALVVELLGAAADADDHRVLEFVRAEFSE